MNLSILTDLMGSIFINAHLLSEGVKFEQTDYTQFQEGNNLEGIKMYDPTIFENLKVAFENHVYDLDNMDRKITILNRADRMDFSILTRDFAIQFTLLDQPHVTAEIVLKASLEDLAGEILEMSEINPGCYLFLRFNKRVHNVAVECANIEQALNTISEDDIYFTQTLSFMYEQADSGFQNRIDMKFKNKINEENMGEIGDFLTDVLRDMLEVLNET